ncbi:Cardiolipin synthase B [Candidatus Anstonella stagnisolia]|nr:Cardiolipin synthase B [Candidatus Anstonella stagnisolia]
MFAGFALASFLFLAFIFAYLYLFPSPSLASSGCFLQKAVFSPNSEDDVVSFFNSAGKTIDVEMYVFSNQNIARSLANAAKRGVRVRLILEGRIEGVQENANTFDYLVSSGAYAKWASLSYKLTHSKLAIVDGRKVLVGSINFSNAAVTKNREAAAMLYCNENNEYVRTFEEDWQKAGG